MQKTTREKLADTLIEAKIVCTTDETETGVTEGTIEPGLHTYKCQYTMNRFSYEPYDVLINKAYGTYGTTQKGEELYGNRNS